MADSVFASTNRGGETHNSKARRKAMKRTLCESVGNPAVNRRRFLNAALAACTIGPPLGFLSMQLAASRAGSRSLWRDKGRDRRRRIGQSHGIAGEDQTGHSGNQV